MVVIQYAVDRYQHLVLRLTINTIMIYISFVEKHALLVLVIVNEGKVGSEFTIFYTVYFPRREARSARLVTVNEGKVG